MLLYSRNKARYRKDGYCWKKRKDGKNIREDHMKLKVQGLENPDIVLVHYLNVPYPDNTKVKIPMMPSCTLEKKEWTKEDLVDQLKPMFSTGRTDEESEQMIEETVEALVRHLIEYHENSKRIEKDRLDQKKLQDSMIHSNVHHPETREATYPKQSNLTHTTSCINQQIASFTSELQQKSNLERKNEGNSGYIVHHKASDHDMKNDLDLNSQSVNMSQVPYILSVNGHLNVPSANYVVVNGQGGVVTPSASLSNLHHAIDSVPPNVVISQGSLNSHCSSQFVHNLSSHVQTKVENSGERSPTVSVPEKCSNCNFPVQFTSQCRSGNVPNVLKDGKGNMVPHLSTVTVEDVQNVIQSHNSKEKSGEDQNGSTIDQLNGSLGSSDFDNLDLELPDIDKLCSFLGTPLDTSPSSHTTVASSTCTLNHVSCLETQCQGHTHDITQGQGHNHDYGDGGQVHDEHLHGGHDEGQDHTMLHSGTKNKVDIVDICPEWSYTEGGSKLLVVGPWFNLTSQYTCVIAGNPVPTTCIQPGVLRCYTPAHSEGFASLEVTCDGHVISSPVHIEYKVKQTSGKYCQWFNLPGKDIIILISCDGHVISSPVHIEFKVKQTCGKYCHWFNLPEKELRMLLIDRLNYLEERLAQSHYRDGPIPSLKQAANNLVVSDDLEGKLLWYIKMFSAGTWSDLDTFPVSNKYEMTLLHLSAALGYNRLIQAVINWRLVILKSTLCAHK
ncbi:hypothetical protein FSP39_025027 [Pinctada imbricata]|uniref:CG-1 domain-containing protein n=1 Tax=Pinctada imbricata TaxID=66713 RepID=A0AA89C8H8_PINIB|nr:hypothetical protein FSP39_025027 [Pinctada imbricata]